MLISEELILTWQGREMEGQVRGHPARQRQPAKGGASQRAQRPLQSGSMFCPLRLQWQDGETWVQKFTEVKQEVGLSRWAMDPEKNGVLILKIMIGTGVYPKRMAFELGNMRFETSGSSRCIQVPHFRTNPCESHVPGC